MTYERLKLAYWQADKIDHAEGLVAYQRYHDLMQSIADKYGSTLYRVIAVFVSLSPNSTYHHNLRSAVSTLKAIQEGVPVEAVQVATYRHCLLRAYAYGTGEADFFAKTRGPKITNFFHNIMNPADTRWVTIDGHMSALWQGEALTMRDALVSLRMYRTIAADVKRLAFEEFILPQQMQAILWFVRKRLLNIGFNSQTDILQIGDQWKTARNADDIEPYPWRHVGPEHMGSARTLPNIRKPDAGPRSLRRLMLPDIRASEPDRLSLFSSMGVESPVQPRPKKVLPAPRCDDHHGRELPMRRNGKAHSAAKNRKPNAASGDHSANGHPAADAEAHRRTPRRQHAELRSRELGVGNAAREHENERSGSAVRTQLVGDDTRAGVGPEVSARAKTQC